MAVKTDVVPQLRRALESSLAALRWLADSELPTPSYSGSSNSANAKRLSWTQNVMSILHS